MLQECSGQLIVLPVVVELHLAQGVDAEEGKYNEPSHYSKVGVFRYVICGTARDIK